MLNRFWLNDRGATALEYGFIAGLISIAGLFNFVFPVLGLLALVLIRGRSTAQVSPADDPSASDVHR